ncbi:hypothetical protein WJS89_02890 [Sphingomicrobium sp. XHP0235]|uniref:hypothetical protein n=1 Tax=Sphingomicrobium aquimarinum TaxID=3133971 RepID=UPI0031FEA03C
MSEILRLDPEVNGHRARLRLGPHDLFWESDAPFQPQNGDWTLFAALPYAMLRGARLQIDMPVSREAASNATRFSEYFAQRFPGHREVSIEARAFTDPPPISNEVGMCYSGGVDASFALLEAQRQPMLREPDWLLFLQGYDYALDDRNYQAVLAHLRVTTALPVRSVRTNWKQSVDAERFGLYHTQGLAAVLHLFAPQLAQIAADFTFEEDANELAYGSNGTLNRLLSGSATRIEPVGERATRVEKVEALVRNGRSKDLFVCYHVREGATNCGRCNKCKRTQLQIEAVGGGASDYIRARLSAGDLWSIRIGGFLERHFLKQTLRRTPWDARSLPVRVKLAAMSAYAALRRPFRPLKAWLRK